jgi:hypothetical protein
MPTNEFKHVCTTKHDGEVVTVRRHAPSPQLYWLYNDVTRKMEKPARFCMRCGVVYVSQSDVEEHER